MAQKKHNGSSANDSAAGINSNGNGNGVRVSRSFSRLHFFENPEFDFQALRVMGSALYGGSALGECLSTIRRITDDDLPSWCAEWTTTATGVHDAAVEAEKNGDLFSAREHFLRASMYYRAAEHFRFFSETRRRDSWNKSRECFRKAGACSESPFRPVKIPFEDKYLPGYFMAPANDGKKRPTVIIFSGFDGTSEEMYFLSGAAALQRGYNVLLFEGPGQTGMLHLFPDAIFRPDYEVPMKAVMDYLLSRPDVDPDRCAVIGLSLAGYFATRAVVSEKRIKACIANSPIVNMHDYIGAILPASISKTDPARYNDIMRESGIFRWVYETFTHRFAVKDFPHLMERLKEFSYEGQENEITCATLTLVGEGEGPEALGQAWHFYNSVSGPKKQHIFTVAEGADAHCQVNNLSVFNGVVYRWLDEMLK